MIPIFRSDFSIGRSILTLEPDTEIKDNKPVSIYAIAKKHELPSVDIVDSTISALITAYKSSEKTKIPFQFGLKLTVTNDMSEKTEESLKKESKVIVWLQNMNGYESLVRISTAANVDGFYYEPRIDWSTLKKFWNSNLFLSFPFYDSFVHNNVLRGHSSIPAFIPDESNYIIEEHGLPIDNILLNAVKKASSNTMSAHTCFYYKTEDARVNLLLRCITNRTKWEEPKQDHHGSDQFSFEAFLAKNDIQ